MRRYLVFMIPAVYQPKDGRQQPEPDFAPDPEQMAQMGRFNDGLKRSGALLSAEGLKPLTNGARLAFSDDVEPILTDGEALDVAEVVGGYWMLQADTKQEVISWMKRCPAQDGDVIEIRQIAELTDFPADVQAAARG